jgi:hypothetical protein
MKKDVHGTPVLLELLSPVRVADTVHRGTIAESKFHSDRITLPSFMTRKVVFPGAEEGLPAAPERIFALELVFEAHTQGYIEAGSIGVDAEDAAFQVGAKVGVFELERTEYRFELPLQSFDERKAGWGLIETNAATVEGIALKLPRG